MLNKAITAAAELTADDATAKTQKEKARKFIDATKGLTYNPITPIGFVTDAYSAPSYSDGVTPLPVSEASTGFDLSGQIVLKKLSNTYVLTLTEPGTSYMDIFSGYVIPLIQPFANANNTGDAEIDVTKIYYKKNLKKANETTYGKYYDYSPINADGFVNSEQPFNPYAQFVVEKASVDDKVYYTITNRADENRILVGVINNLKDQDGKLIDGQYVIGTDSFALVVADVDGDDIFVGSKHFTTADITNKAYKIQTTSQLLDNLFINTVSETDSSLNLSDEDLLFRAEVATSAATYGKAQIQGVAKQLKAESYYLYTENSDKADAGKAYVAVDASTTKFYLTTDPAATKAEFSFLAADTDGSYALVLGHLPANTLSGKLAVNAQTALLYPAAVNAKNDLFRIIEEDAAQSLFTMPTEEVQLLSSTGDLIGVGADNFARTARVGDLKSTFEEADFTFFLDTAYYTDRTTGAEVETPSYYISKGDGAKRLYLYAATDSATAATVNKDQYTYDGSTRLQFTEAEIVNYDTLRVTFSNTTRLVSLAKKTVDGITEVYDDVKDYRFQFLKDVDSDAFVMKSEGKNAYVKSVNGFVVLDANIDNAMRVTPTTSEGPVANETVVATGVKVIGSEGAVVVKYASGKMATVTNILGQVVASRVLASDDESIVAPKGIVIVSVEGDAVKVFVK